MPSLPEGWNQEPVEILKPSGWLLIWGPRQTTNSQTPIAKLQKPPFLRSSLLLFCACFPPISLALISTFVWGRSGPGFDCTPHLGTAVLLLLSELLSSSDLLGHYFWLCVWVCWRVERGWRRTGLVGWSVVRGSLNLGSDDNLSLSFCGGKKEGISLWKKEWVCEEEGPQGGRDLLLPWWGEVGSGFAGVCWE